MLSYQHAYHAGNLADLHKHAVLAVLLKRMADKPRPITYVETHAGRGLYDLDSKEAKKTGEAKMGIDKRLKAGVPPLGHPLRGVVDQVREAYGPRTYPGSPWIALSLVNPGSTAHLFELHPQEFQALDELMKGPGRDLARARDLTLNVGRLDGFQATLDLAPPHAKRGLVLIDPSYEVKTDYAAAADFIVRLNAQWPEACVVLWYPILEAGLYEDMAQRLKDGLAKQGAIRLERREVRFKAADRREGHRMLGSGLLILNAPFGSDKGLAQVDGWIG